MVNSQYAEKVRKVLHKMLNSNLGADGKIILLLLVKQPRTTEEICTKVGITENHFKYVLSKKLIEEGLIKQLPDDSWVLWDYEPLGSKQKYGASDIAYMIEIFEDENLHQDIRKKAEYGLWKCCSSDSEIVDGKNELRTFFIKTLDSLESNKGIVFKHIYTTLENYAVFQLRGKEDIIWMNELCYPKLLHLFKKRSFKERNRILSVLLKIYRIDKLDTEQPDLTRLLRKNFFDPEEDESIAIRCRDILWSWADDKLKEKLRDEISTMSKSEDERLKERGLKSLEKIIGEVSENDNTRIFSS